MTKEITEYKGRPIDGIEVVYLDTPGVGYSTVPLSMLYAMLEKQLAGRETKIDGVLVATPVDCGPIKLGAQVVKFLVSKGFEGGEKWKNVVLVGTKNDKADDGDRQVWPQFVEALFDEAPGKTGPNVLVDWKGYKPLEKVIASLSNAPIKYVPPTEAQVRAGLGRTFVSDKMLEEFLEQTRVLRTQFDKEKVKREALARECAALQQKTLDNERRLREAAADKHKAEAAATAARRAQEDAERIAEQALERE
jgi:hypothetical protein